jgi:hypothetical protein
MESLPVDGPAAETSDTMSADGAADAAGAADANDFDGASADGAVD